MSRYIDADALKEKFINTDANGINLTIDRYALKCIEDAPSIDIVRCKECKYAEDCEQMVVFENGKYITSGYKLDHCSYGEREGE